MKLLRFPVLAVFCAVLQVFGANPAVSSPAAAVPPPAGSDEMLSVDFPDEDVQVILRQIADQLGLNLVMPDSFQGRTTLKFRNVTWRQIFDAVLSPVNHMLVEEGNILKVVSQESLKQEPMTIEVILIHHARAADLAPIVRALIDEAAGGKVLVDARINALIITERPSRLGQARPVTAQLDRG